MGGVEDLFLPGVAKQRKIVLAVARSSRFPAFYPLSTTLVRLSHGRVTRLTAPWFIKFILRMYRCLRMGLKCLPHRQ